MTDRELMQQALASLEGYARNCRCEGSGGLCDAGKALRERLAQPEQEPVWVEVTTNTGDKFILDSAVEADKIRAAKNVGLSVVPLYTTPPQRDDAPAKAVEWQGLTDEERAEAWAKTKGDLLLRLPQFSLAIEAKLREKNGAV